MAIYRTAPNGKLMTFPDGTSEDDIQKAFSEIQTEIKAEVDKGALASSQEAIKTNPIGNWLFDNLAVAPYEASRKFLNSTFDLTEGIGDTLGEKIGIGGFKYGKDANNGLLQYVGYDQAIQDKNVKGILSPITGNIGVKDAYSIKGFFYNPDDPDNDNHTTTTTGQFVETIGQFLIGFKGADKLFKIGKIAPSTTKLGSFAEVTAKGAIADFVAFDEDSGRLTDLLSQYAPETVDKYLGYLQSDPNDTWWEGRLKNTIEGAGIGSIAEILFRMARSIKGTGSSKQIKEDLEVINKTQETLDTIKNKLDNASSVSEKMKLINEAVDNSLKSTFKTKRPLTKKNTTTILRNLADVDLKENFKKWEKGQITTEEAFNIPQAFINLETFKGGISLDGMKTFKSFYDAIYKYNKKFSKKVTDEAIKRKAVNDYGGDINKVFQDFSKFADNIDNTSSLIFAHEVALTSLMNAFPKFVRLYKSGQSKYTAKDMDMLYFMLDNMMNNRKTVGSASGRNLRVFQLTKEQFDKSKIIEEQILKDIDAYKNFGGGQKGFDRFLDQVAKADNPDAIRKVINLTWRNKTWNVLNEYWINALLSSPKTQMVNAVSNGILMAVRPVEDMVGNKISQMIAGDDLIKAQAYKRQLDESVTTLASLSHYVGDANRYFVEAFRNGDQILQKGDIQAGKLDTANVKTIPTKFGGEVIRLPSRFLNAGDEWFKQINYRAKLKGIAVREGKRAIQEGTLKAKNLKEWVDEFIRQGFDETGLRGTNEEALRYAEENTFTNELVGITAKFQEMIIANPFLKQFFPFVKTPFNIAKAVADRTPFGALYRQADFLGKSGDPRQIAKVRGQFAVGSIVLGAGYLLAQNGIISGRTNYKGDGKPLNVYKDQELIRQKKSGTGFRQYSIKFPNGWQMSFGQLDPFGALLGIMADFVTIYDQLTEEEIERIGMNTNMWLYNQDGDNPLNWLQKTQITTSALYKGGQRNILSKTYLKAMTDIIDAINSEDGNKLERYLVQKVDSFVPNIFKKALNDPYYRDTRDLLDQVLYRIGLGEVASPRYNSIGEPHMDKDSFVHRMVKNSLDIFGTTKLKEDVVAQELLRLGKPLSQWKDHIDGVPYKEFKKGKMSAWDRINQKLATHTINGKTLRQALEEEIKSSDYLRREDITKVASGVVAGTGRHSKIAQLNLIVEKYKQQVLLDFEDEKQDYKSVEDRRQTLDLAHENLTDNKLLIDKPRDADSPLNKSKLKPILEFYQE